jgi:PadR family transcriptional regulator, regulatory protein PadR
MAQVTILQGTLDLLILKALSLGELHGLGIARRIGQVTKGAFQPGPGSLFPALHRLERAGLLTSEFGKSETRRDAKYYALTKKGRKQLQIERAEWTRIVAAMALALESA